MSHLGFVGAGRLGLAMVEQLVAAGHDVVVHARRSEARDQLSALGARPTADLVEVARDSDAVLTCVFSDEQLLDFADIVVGAMPAGASFGSHVTGSASTLEGIAARHPHVRVVEAPVSGTAADVRARRMTVLLGGPADGCDVIAAAVDPYAGHVIRTGERGTAAAIKLLNNLLLGVHVQVLGEAARVGEALGVATPTLLTALSHMSGSSRAVDHALLRPDMDTFVSVVTPFLTKDVAACRNQADELGIDLGMLLEIVREGPFALDTLA